MKIMTYNILGEDEKKISDVLAVVSDISPDYLAIQEANYFAKNDNYFLKLFSEKSGLPYCDIAEAFEYDYHVASFSKYKFKAVNKPKGFRNAALETVIDCELGEVAICNVHMSPYTEDKRSKEAEIILKQQREYANKIVLGDLNSLSRHDDYDLQKIIKNDTQSRKFTIDGRLQFEVISLFEDFGYTDLMLAAGINQKNTVPTPMNVDPAHGKLRLDYIFASAPLAKRCKYIDVIKNHLTDRTSDHYPVVAELNQ